MMKVFANLKISKSVKTSILGKMFNTNFPKDNDKLNSKSVKYDLNSKKYKSLNLNFQTIKEPETINSGNNNTENYRPGIKDMSYLKYNLIAKNSIFKKNRGVVNFRSSNISQLDLDLPHAVSVKQELLANSLANDTKNIMLKNYKEFEVFIILFAYFTRHCNKNKFIMKDSLNINLAANHSQNKENHLKISSNNISLVFFVKNSVEIEQIIKKSEEHNLKAIFIKNIYKNNFYNSTHYLNGLNNNSNNELDEEVIKRLSIADVLIIYPELFLENKNFFKNFITSYGILYVLNNLSDESFSYCISSINNKWMTNSKDRFIIIKSYMDDLPNNKYNSANNKFKSQYINILNNIGLQQQLNLKVLLGNIKEYDLMNSQVTNVNSIAVS
jgi:hypothetical protein